MSDEMTFREAIELFRKVYHRFEKIEGKPWGAEGAMIEIMKQVGELAKHVMIAENYYFTLPLACGLAAYSRLRESVRGVTPFRRLIGL